MGVGGFKLLPTRNLSCTGGGTGNGGGVGATGGEVVGSATLPPVAPPLNEKKGGPPVIIPPPSRLRQLYPTPLPVHPQIVSEAMICAAVIIYMVE